MIRVLLIDDDLAALEGLGNRLAEAGHRVQLLAHPTLAIATARDFSPELVLVDESMKLMSGRETVISLRAFRATAEVPVVILCSQATTFEDELRWLQLGVADVWRPPFGPAHFARLPVLLEERNTHQTLTGLGPYERQRNHVLAHLKRLKKNGTLQVDPDTPFGGRAVFVNGELTQARLGPLEDVAALDEMLSLEKGRWRWLDGQAPVTQPAAPAAPPGFRPSVLVVEDEEALRKLIAKQLERAGFTVESAADGVEGCQLALSKPFDAVVADLNMPVLDGWGMIRALKAEVKTREVPILVLSAHDDYRETLKAARAGAREYLKKTGHADELVQRVKQLVAPRAAVWELLVSKRRTDRLEAGIVGPAWFLEALAELDCTGELSLSDFWGRYRVSVDRGAVLKATVDAGGRHAEGAMAIAALIASKGPVGTFEARPVPPSEPAHPVWLSDLLTQARAQLKAMEAAQTKRGLAAGQVAIDESLAALFLEVGAEREVRVLVALKASGGALAPLAQQLDLPPESLEEAVLELLRRAVIRFEAD